jgi:hypothetical protein
MKRQLMQGSKTIQNAAERKSAENWLKPCFPRFYLYDALRGLSALLKWSAITGQTVDPESIRVVVNYFAQRYPKGNVKIERQSFEKVGTILQVSTGEWIKRQPASLFPLLSKVSVIGEESPFLTRQWEEITTMIRENSHLKNLL